MIVAKSARRSATENPLKTLELVYTEGQSLLTRQLQGLTELDGKATQIMTLSATVLAVVLAGISILADTVERAEFFGDEAWLSWLGIGILIAGVFALLVAIVFSVVTFVKKDIPIGLKPEDLETVIAHGASPEAYLEAATNAYISGTKAGAIENYKSAGQLQKTIIFFLLGISFVTVGAGILIGRVLSI